MNALGSGHSVRESLSIWDGQESMASDDKAHSEGSREDHRTPGESSSRYREKVRHLPVEKVHHLPALGPSAKAVEREWVAGGLGFWVLWHLYGGPEGLRHYGFHPATIHRKAGRFKETFGADPDDFVLPGVAIDPKQYWEAPGIKVGPR